MATLFKDVYILDGSRAKAERVHLLVSKVLHRLRQVLTKSYPDVDTWRLSPDS